MTTPDPTDAVQVARELAETAPLEGMRALAHCFPRLRPALFRMTRYKAGPYGPSGPLRGPWQPIRIYRAAASYVPADRWAARFVLDVWCSDYIPFHDRQPETRDALGSFLVVPALDAWSTSHHHRQVFLAWASDPFFNLEERYQLSQDKPAAS